MRLTVRSDYSLRMLMLLALEPNGLHTIDSIADRYVVSRSHMMKVAATLANAGLVEGVRGRAGGLRLARNACEIQLGEVIRLVEDQVGFVECFDRETNQCVVTPACAIKCVLNQALAEFWRVLDGYTLAQMVGTPGAGKMMRQLLFSEGSDA